MPTGECYHKLLRSLQPFARWLYLVERIELGRTKNLGIFLSRLEPWLEDTRVVSEWPGTILLNGTAILRVYSSSPEMIAPIVEASTSPSHWIQPELPEDIAYVRASKAPLLSTVAHENDMVLNLTERELSLLCDACPNIKQGMTFEVGVGTKL